MDRRSSHTAASTSALVLAGLWWADASDPAAPPARQRGSGPPRCRHAAARPIAGRDLGHRLPIQHPPHRLIALFDHAPLPQHPLGLLPTTTDTPGKQTERSCQPSPETGKELVKPTCQASPEPEHRAGEVRWEKFLYTLKAGPAGGRLRRPSSRRRRHDGHAIIRHAVRRG
jgi:hypothetical protein